MHWIDEHGEEALLPGVNFTQTQLFFLNFAQVCTFLSLTKALSTLATIVAEFGDNLSPTVAVFASVDRAL